MVKKSIIIGLVLLLAGAAVFGWSLWELREEQRLQDEYDARLAANLYKVDKVLAGEAEVDIFVFGDAASQKNLQRKLDEYKSRKEIRELAFNVSIALMLGGGCIFVWWLLSGIARLGVRSSCYLIKLLRGFFKRDKETKDKQASSFCEKQEDGN